MPRRFVPIVILILLIRGLTANGPPASRYRPPVTQTCAGFYDGFKSPPLDPGWSWINEDRWSLTERPGYLRVYTDHTEDDATYLVREAPDGIGAIWSHLEVEPAVNFQLAGVTVYQDNDNYLRLVRALTFGQHAIFVLRQNDEIQVELAEVDAELRELRIEKQGNTYIGYHRSDGDLVEVGRFEDVHFGSPRVGLVTTAGEGGASPVDFDDFCLEPPIPGTPTPTTTSPGDLTLTGQVYDAAVGPARGISGARVSVIACESHAFEILSGRDGRYTLIVLGQYLKCGQVTLQVRATGYERLSQPIAVSDLRAQPERDFALTPLPYAMYLPLLRTSAAPPPPPPPPPTPTPTPFDPTSFDLELELIADSLTAPVHVTHAGDASDRLFVVEKPGTIRIVADGEVNPTPFLDIRQIVGSRGSEQGLLSMAFHPDYAANGSFFVNYTDTNGDTVVARYTVSANPDAADPNSARTILTLDQPFTNHNGGLLLFGPDGYLYIGTGDGGSGGDPRGNAQNPQVLLGKMLRLDVDTPALSAAEVAEPYAIPPDNPFAGDPETRDEIWALGLRNPWRYSFDRVTGDLYIADVGQNAFEEIDFQPAGSSGGENYGWNIMEGIHCFSPSTNCDQSGLTLPIAEYGHDLGCSVTGGYVYRGAAFPRMAGAYYFGDFCSGRIWALYRDEAGQWTPTELLQSGLGISSFGEDEDGELYLTSLNDGKLYQLVAAGAGE